MCVLGRLALSSKASLKKRHRRPIENPPSVQNPSEGQSRSAEVTFLRANQKEEWEKPDNMMRQRESKQQLQNFLEECSLL